MLLSFIVIILIFFFIWNFIVPFLVIKIKNDQNLKSKYKNCKWALVTGGSSGIGKEICERLLAQGISVVIVSSSGNGYTNKLLEKYSKGPVRVKLITLDLSQKESCKKLIKEIEDDNQIEKETLKLLFNNVGYLTMEAFNQTTIEAKMEMIQCNVLTAVELTDYFYKQLIKNKSNDSSDSNGAILFTSSITGLCPTPFSAMYASGKSFITCFAKSLAIESRYHGIDVLVVQPGLVNTNLFLEVPKHLIFSILRLVGQEPSQIVDIMFRGLGTLGFVVYNGGIFGLVSDLCCSILGINFMLNVVYYISNYLLKDFNCYKYNN
ncbi:hypothetical protein DICPUDRAFT_10447, partial [Dictyostelium purpureum]